MYEKEYAIFSFQNQFDILILKLESFKITGYFPTKFLILQIMYKFYAESLSVHGVVRGAYAIASEGGR